MIYNSGIDSMHKEKHRTAEEHGFWGMAKDQDASGSGAPGCQSSCKCNHFKAHVIHG